MSGSGMMSGRTFGSMNTIAWPESFAIRASTAPADGSTTRPSVPAWTIRTSSGRAAKAASGVRPAAAVPSV